MDLRASDGDRHRVIAALQQHTAAGRLTLDEFSERVGSVYAARTLGELAATTVDLPFERAEPATVEEHHGRQLAVAFLIAIIAVVLFAVAYTLAT